MKQIHCTVYCVVLCCFFLLMGRSDAQTTGTECIGPLCRTDRGFIEYSSGTNKLWLISKQTAQVTTVILHLKDVSPQVTTNWLLIQAYNHTSITSEVRINTSDNRMLVFSSATAIAITVQNNDVEQFTINYYVGCNVIEGRNVSIVHQSTQRPQDIRNSVVSSHQFLTESTCWVVVPRVRERVALSAANIAYLQELGYTELPEFWIDHEVQQAYMTLKNVASISGSNVLISNFFTGRAIGESQAQYQSALTATKYNETTRYDSRQISSVYIIDLICETAEKCRQTNFKFNAYAMDQSDVNCVKYETCGLNDDPEAVRNCRNSLGFTIPTTREAQETDDFTSPTCPVFNLISQDLLAKFIDEESTVPGLRVVGFGKQLERKIKRCNKLSDKFCSYPCNNAVFTNKSCRKICLYMRRLFKKCDQRSIFA